MSHDDANDLGLQLSKWPIIVGTLLWISGVIVGIISAVSTFHLMNASDTGDGATGDVRVLGIRWGLGVALIVGGLILATSNGRARKRSAKNTLREVAAEQRSAEENREIDGA